VWVDDRPISIGYRQLQIVLAVLLVEVNHSVSFEALVDRVWGDRPLPRRPRAAVQHSMTMLGAALAGVDEVAISWRSTSYRLSVAAEAVDVHRFRAAAAPGTPEC
jgi:DNA-binding SARP family transcriptional activator